MGDKKIEEIKFNEFKNYLYREIKDKEIIDKLNEIIDVINSLPPHTKE